MLVKYVCALDWIYILLFDLEIHPFVCVSMISGAIFVMRFVRGGAATVDTDRYMSAEWWVAGVLGSVDDLMGNAWCLPKPPLSSF